MHPSTNINDHFHRFTLGHQSGLTHLYNQYHTPLIRYGLHILPDHFAVENIVQDAFLKAWSFRQRLTNPLHAYRFMRLNVRWACYDHFQQAEYRNTTYTEHIDQYNHAWQELPIGEEQSEHPHDAMLQTINKVLPYLPENRRTLVELYFKQGYTGSQIAKRLATNTQAINYEVQQALTQLKQMIHTSQQPKPQTKQTAKKDSAYSKHLSGELLQLFILRYERQQSFEAIAIVMNLPQPYIQQQYVKAHITLQQLP